MCVSPGYRLTLPELSSFVCLFVSRGGCVSVGHLEEAGEGVGAGYREGARGDGWGWEGGKGGA